MLSADGRENHCQPSPNGIVPLTEPMRAVKDLILGARSCLLRGGATSIFQNGIPPQSTHLLRVEAPSEWRECSVTDGNGLLHRLLRFLASRSFLFIQGIQPTFSMANTSSSKEDRRERQHVCCVPPFATGSNLTINTFMPVSAA